MDESKPEPGDNGESLEQNPASPDYIKAPAPIPPKRGLRRRLAGFNIYLLLFVFLLLLAAAGAIILVTRNNQTKKTPALSGQDLSQAELQNLAQNTVAIGNPDQVLKVGSNAIFAGQVLVQKDLDVAGGLNVGGSLKLTNLDVGGAASFGSLATGQLTDSGSDNIKGALSVGQALSVAGSANFGGAVAVNQLTASSLNLNSDLNLTHHIQAGGATPGHSSGNALGAGGTTSLSGSDTAGVININTGGNPSAGCFINVNFASSFHTAPYIVVTPVGSAAGSLQYYVNRSSGGFSVCSDNSAAGGSSFGFDYVALD
ncbi:MAG: hypothetical protein ACREGF_01540 [Candidatus Saccharimonadales bacterium]